VAEIAIKWVESNGFSAQFESVPPPAGECETLESSAGRFLCFGDGRRIEIPRGGRLEIHQSVEEGRG